MRAAGIREQHLTAEPGEQCEQLVDVAALVEHVRGEHEIPRSALGQRIRLAPANPRDAQEDAVALCVPPQQLDRVVRPVRRKDVGPPERGGERRQPEAAAELEHAQPVQLPGGDVPGEREAARPELRPVRQKLLLVERGLVDQLVRARRTEDPQAQLASELDLLLDEVQRAAKRSTGLPSGSRSWA